MKKNLLLICFISSVCIAYSQTIEITSACGPANALGIYTIESNINGKPSYFKQNTDCSENLTQASCGATSGHSYGIFWNGTRWEWRIGSCEWDTLFEQCMNNSLQRMEMDDSFSVSAVIAYNDNDTSLPPNSEWMVQSSGFCEPMSTNFETLSVANFNLKGNLTVFPNPIENVINFKTKEVYESLTITIYNLLGRQIVKHVFINSDTATIEFQQPSGIYVAELKNEHNQTAYIKLQKK